MIPLLLCYFYFLRGADKKERLYYNVNQDESDGDGVFGIDDTPLIRTIQPINTYSAPAIDNLNHSKKQ